MHIGGMRTALFNWLWARHNGGQFVLRIDDTDRQRNIEEAIEPILSAFRWLGLDWDEGPDVGGPHAPYFQSQRTNGYQEAVDKLLEEGHAYRCYETPEQIQADREAAEKEKRPYVSLRRSLELSFADHQEYDLEGKPYVIRFLVPRDKKVEIDDAVRGHVEWDAGLMSDPVIMRSDGSALYNFATVVDDSDLEITHVIRAEEHLSNTPVQVLLYEALGKPVPEFAHIPFVTAPGSSKKLSKRDLDKYKQNPQFRKMFEMGETVLGAIGLGLSETLNPVMVSFYEKTGYLPAGVLNGLARLGWSLDDKTEIFSREALVEKFTLDRIVKGAAGFDPDKLNSYQAHWMNKLPLSEKISGCLPFLERSGLVKSPVEESTKDFVGRLITALADRLKIFGDIVEHADFFTADDELPYDEKAFEKRIVKAEAAPLLTRFRGRLAVCEPFENSALDQLMHDFCEAEEIKIGQIIHAVRVATTGKPQGPGMFDCLELLGRERCLRRIDRALERAS